MLRLFLLYACMRIVCIPSLFRVFLKKEKEYVCCLVIKPFGGTQRTSEKQVENKSGKRL